MSGQSFRGTVSQARQALGWTQRELGERLGSSLRTASRWECGHSTMVTSEVARLASHVYPVRPDIAEQLAAHVGQTLVGLGVVAPPLPAPPPGPPSPARRVMTTKDILDSITYAVADAMNAPPKQVREVVLLALRKAHELGMELDSAAKEGALAEDVAPHTVTPASRGTTADPPPPLELSKGGATPSANLARLRADER